MDDLIGYGFFILLAIIMLSQVAMVLALVAEILGFL